MAHFSLTSWQVTVSQAVALLPLYVLIYPLTRWICWHALRGGRIILYAYPYVVTYLALMGFIVAGILDNHFEDEAVDPYMLMSFMKYLPLMVACNAWVQRYLRLHLPRKAIL